MNFFRIILLSFLSLAFFSCKDKLELNAPYKEVPSIYAVLNPSEKMQMIRVNKVFLGEGDANQMAKVSDSINYAEKELTIKLEHYNNYGQKDIATQDGDSEIIFTDTLIKAQPGAFSTTQRVYITRAKLLDEGEYRLTVKNNKTGNIFKSSAKPVKPAEFGVFNPLASKLEWPYPANTDPNSTDYIDYSNTTRKTPYDIRYAVSEAYAYQLIMRFYFDETPTAGYLSPRTIDYNAGSKTLKDAVKNQGLTYFSHTFTAAGIFGTVASELSKNPSGNAMKFYRIDYIVHTTTQEYMDYLEYLKPSLSITQNKPLYSNFENSAALGIFTFRNTQFVKKQPAAVYVSSFSDNPITCSYRFYDFLNTIRGCK